MVNTTVFAGRLPSTATDEKIRETFSKYGNVTAIENHAALKGFAFVTFETRDQMSKCLIATEVTLDGAVLNMDEKGANRGKGKGGKGKGGGGPSYNYKY
mmetsp:Transcript_15021/g.26850  ORF Transcript_15021/g.26850 Transcript_15021/m.26850 type:complete len:99 (+) Transcript_15021:44-340(+)|eukprot:CAMPEP_0174289918 /NCGR_PEP_ID=MMETSP0809-20121228/26882_1 /TAXON_ID=73025 ORGANISM="Eutreptiella gymnastica-like, Strain CCMP1594" /NCGR_SAMPLE_ID=MMETSP0809 /ASSEMBLY_ACC=CAM_ASM_000658 /LENGTH=98 /DNA_ID=CAMNT_0015388211 /DNA_START=44 /DNA_END=340 /DNA_ORIENTATION=+